MKDWNCRGDFKGYLRQRGAKVSASKLRRIAEHLDTYHEDFGGK